MQNLSIKTLLIILVLLVIIVPVEAQQQNKNQGLVNTMVKDVNVRKYITAQLILTYYQHENDYRGVTETQSYIKKQIELMANTYNLLSRFTKAEWYKVDSKIWEKYTSDYRNEKADFELKDGCKTWYITVTENELVIKKYLMFKVCAPKEEDSNLSTF